MAKAYVGIQLYTLRDQTEKDFLGTIRKVAEMGYEAVEFAGYFGVAAQELRAVLDETGLKAPSAHIGLDFTDIETMRIGLAEQILYAKALGLQYIITPSAPFSEVPTREEVNRIGSFLQAAALQVQEAGLGYGYHNHDFEFKLVDGTPILDILLEKVPAERMIAELDLGWIHQAGAVPAQYVKRYSGRTPLVHVKDFAEGRSDTEVGRGQVDFDSVFKLPEAAGIQYYFVEQEQFEGPSLESARSSLDYFRARGML